MNRQLVNIVFRVLCILMRLLDKVVSPHVLNTNEPASHLQVTCLQRFQRRERSDN